MSRRVLLEKLKNNPEALERCLAVVGAHEPPSTVCSPVEALPHLIPLLCGVAEERLVAIYLNRRNHVLETAVLTVGSDAFTVVCPRQIFRRALLAGRSGAAGVILAHNHPSGDPAPSEQDREVTRRVVRAGGVIGIPLIDHIVVVDSGAYTSMRECDDVSFEVPPQGSWTA